MIHHKNQERILGKEPYSLRVSPIGLGCMELSISKNKGKNKSIRLDESEAINFIIQAWKLGVRLFDTADIYGHTDKKHGIGHNELILGEALARLREEPKFKREEIVVSTKVGIILEPEFSINNSSNYIREAVENSSKRLKEETIDLLYIHRFDEKYPIQDMMICLKELATNNKIRCIGLSEVSLNVLKLAHELHPITAVQLEFSPWHQTNEAKEIINFCDNNEIGIVISTPLGRGFFSETKSFDFFSKLPCKDFRSIFPRLTHHLQDNIAQRKTLETVAQEQFNCSLSQLVLAWLLAQSPRLVPIPGTANLLHLKENLFAMSITFSIEQLKLLDHTITSTNFVGDNQPEFSDLKEKMKGPGYFYSE